jgi:DNA-binding HxlR family transcriptional regulator
MNTTGVQDRNLKAVEYLQSLRSLTDELERAMQAIAHNALSELEESVDSQQMLSARLGELANDMCVPLEVDPAIPLPNLDEDLRHKIRSASDTLQKLNYRYAALLRHSSHSLARMASLFSSFQGQFQEASGPRLKHQTWSCQM